MTPYELGYRYAFEKLGVYSSGPRNVLDHVATGTPVDVKDEHLPGGQIAQVLSQLEPASDPSRKDVATDGETVGERERRMNAPTTFSTAARVPVDPQTGRLPITPGVY